MPTAPTRTIPGLTLTRVDDPDLTAAILAALAEPDGFARLLRAQALAADPGLNPAEADRQAAADVRQFAADSTSSVHELAPAARAAFLRGLSD